mmetsp:Transcript_59274/g.129808  ORF Transcript_59274/g.129808 Transcript_59274/m.129808 type:complete len:222 (+) Transcript_59274:23-688(+)
MGRPSPLDLPDVAGLILRMVSVCSVADLQLVSQGWRQMVGLTAPGVLRERGVDPALSLMEAVGLERWGGVSLAASWVTAEHLGPGLAVTVFQHRQSATMLAFLSNRCASVFVKPSQSGKWATFSQGMLQHTIWDFFPQAHPFRGIAEILQGQAKHLAFRKVPADMPGALSWTFKGTNGVLVAEAVDMTASECPVTTVVEILPCGVRLRGAADSSIVFHLDS